MAKKMTEEEKRRKELYAEHGARNRTEYLHNLADENGVPIGAVMALASVLGPSEDFDGLVAEVEDFSCVF